MRIGPRDMPQLDMPTSDLFGGYPDEAIACVGLLRGDLDPRRLTARKYQRSKVGSGLGVPAVVV